MLALKRVAITGGTSSGKSTVCQFFKDLGAYVISADEIVHQQLSPNSFLGQQVIDLIGPEIVIDNKIDRSLIASKVFKNPDLLKALEKLIHPVVNEEIEKGYKKALEIKAPLFVAEVPLLFEVSADKNFDFTIVVYASNIISCERFIQKSGNDKKDFTNRMARQFSIEEKAKRADFIINNDGSLEDLKKITEQTFNKLK